MSTALSTMAGKLAARLGMDARTDLMKTQKKTPNKRANVTDEQVTARFTAKTASTRQSSPSIWASANATLSHGSPTLPACFATRR